MRRLAGLSLTLVALLGVPASGQATTLAPGDILVADVHAFDGLLDPGGVIRLDPVTGAQAVISSAGLFHDPHSVALAGNGDILVADITALGGNGAVFRVNPATGAQSVVSSGQYFVNPFGIAVRPDGAIFIADWTAVDGHGAIIRVDATTGAQTVVSSGGFFRMPYGIAIAMNGDILVADPKESVGADGVIIRVDPTTGAQTLISSGGLRRNPTGVAIGKNGDLFVADMDAGPGNGSCSGGACGGVIRVDPVTGAQTLVSFGGYLDAPIALAIEASGTILVADTIRSATPTGASYESIRLPANNSSSRSGTTSPTRPGSPWSPRRSPNRPPSSSSAPASWASA